ncbi:MAG TPA: type II toxin-antitoxin system VapC family toxin [Terriglobia bacterium]|nr:type II toxin-antitoxin system VapC family toxin [Terriglobia bacterium]
MKTCVLDASALMTFFEDRPGADQVEELLAKGAESKHPLLMSVINWGEVFYSIWRAHGEKPAAAKMQEVAQLPIEVVAVDMELTRLATSLKACHNLPYADCFGAALAQSRKATLVTSDKDFERVETVVKILWV